MPIQTQIAIPLPGSLTGNAVDAALHGSGSKAGQDQPSS
jgi:hypothetical protein